MLFELFELFVLFVLFKLLEFEVEKWWLLLLLLLSCKAWNEDNEPEECALTPDRRVLCGVFDAPNLNNSDGNSPLSLTPSNHNEKYSKNK